MKKLILFVFVMFLIGCTSTQQNKVCYNNDCFDVDVVDTEEKRATGLMYIENLDLDKGMLFIFENIDNYPFWMKNTLIPLDIIWIDEDKNVVFIGKNIQPCKSDPCPSTNPGKVAKYVLEINANLADEIGLEIDDVLDFFIN